MRPLPPQLRRRPFTVPEALALGVTPDQLRSKRLHAPHRGVRVPADLPDDLLTRCRAAALALPPRAVFTGRTATELLGLPWRLGADDVLEEPLTVDVPPGTATPRLEGVDAVRCRWAARPYRTRHGLFVLQPVHLWCEVATALPLVDHVALADAVRRWWEPRSRMTAAVAVRAGERDVVRLRQVLALVRYPVDSAMETRLRLLLTGAGLPEPEVGWEVPTSDGRVLGVVDLAWPGARVAVEHEGDHHRTDRRQWQRDVRTRERMRAQGWTVLQLTAEDVLRRPREVVARVAAALARSTAR